jgi:hypothetical protein
MSALSPRQERYWSLMTTLKGFLFVKGKPGIGKTAIFRHLAMHKGLNYIDLRLSMCDECDLGRPVEDEYKGQKCQDTVVPKWALKANEQPTLICFDELNRAKKEVRDSALQILLEREIGTEFRFNDEVYIVALGNLGEEDGTDVEEFDSALNNRAIHDLLELTVPEWVDNYAGEHVHPLIVQHVTNNPEEFYKNPEGDTPAFASPRSWDHLSAYLIQQVGMDATAKDVLPLVEDVGHMFVGPMYSRLVRYLKEVQVVTADDVLNNFAKAKKHIEELNRDIKNEILANLKEYKINDLSSGQYKNLIKFLHLISEDECVSYLLHVLDNNATETFAKGTNAHRMMKVDFKEYKEKIYALTTGAEVDSK